MIHIANALQATIDDALPRLRALSDSQATHDRGAGKWVAKEILGHLIDSAANNHHRFVRARMVDRLIFPGYDQDAWVTAHGYATRSWSELVDVWVAFNVQIAQVISSTPLGRGAVQCVIGDNEAVTLEWLMQDYVRHMKHHLAQILPVEKG
jgi:DinB family protein